MKREQQAAEYFLQEQEWQAQLPFVRSHPEQNHKADNSIRQFELRLKEESSNQQMSLFSSVLKQTIDIEISQSQGLGKILSYIQFSNPADQKQTFINEDNEKGKILDQVSSPKKKSKKKTAEQKRQKDNRQQENQEWQMWIKQDPMNEEKESLRKAKKIFQKKIKKTLKKKTSKKTSKKPKQRYLNNSQKISNDISLKILKQYHNQLEELFEKHKSKKLYFILIIAEILNRECAKVVEKFSKFISNLSAQDCDEIAQAAKAAKIAKNSITTVKQQIYQSFTDKADKMIQKKLSKIQQKPSQQMYYRGVINEIKLSKEVCYTFLLQSGIQEALCKLYQRENQSIIKITESRKQKISLSFIKYSKKNFKDVFYLTDLDQMNFNLSQRFLTKKKGNDILLNLQIIYSILISFFYEQGKIPSNRFII